MRHTLSNKRIVPIFTIITLTTLLASCGASAECCRCVETHNCKWSDRGACNSFDPCAIEDDDDDYYDNDDDATIIDGLVGLFQLFCYIANPRRMSVSYTCAEEHFCLSACSEDGASIDYE